MKGIMSDFPFFLSLLPITSDEHCQNLHTHTPLPQLYINMYTNIGSYYTNSSFMFKQPSLMFKIVTWISLDIRICTCTSYFSNNCIVSCGIDKL